MANFQLVAFALLFCNGLAMAADIPVVTEPLVLAVPHYAPPPESSLEASAMAEPPGRLITVNRLRLTGVQRYSVTVLLARTGFRPGSELSVEDLRAMAARIAEFYRGKGYVAARAWLPAQDILGGNVTIAVEEGR